MTDVAEIRGLRPTAYAGTALIGGLVRNRFLLLPAPVTALFLLVQQIATAARLPGVPRDFQWRDVPESAVLTPALQNVSEGFRLEGFTQSTLRVVFHGPRDPALNPKPRERLRCVIVTPPGGIRSASSEYGPRLFLKDRMLVEPDRPVTPSGGKERFFWKKLGEFRGAELYLVEYEPLRWTRERSLADSIWIPEATLTIYLERPFFPRREVPPIWKPAFQAVILNADLLDRCLPNPGENDVSSMSGVFDGWQTGALKIRTRKRGWYAVSGGEILDKLGKDLSVRNLRLVRRENSIPTTNDSRPGEWGVVPATSETVSRFVFSPSGELKGSGPLQSEDRVVFFSPGSNNPFDPLDCLWLIRNGGSSPGVGMNASGNVDDVTLARIEILIGEDKEFVRGGFKDERQEFFWVDRPFPESATGEIRIPLPDWVCGYPYPMQGTLRLVFASTMDRDYSPPTALSRRNLKVILDGRPLTTVVRTAPSGFGSDVEFNFPPVIRDSTLFVRYDSLRGKQTPLFFDRLLLTTLQPMEWNGNQALYRLPESSSGTFVVRVPREKERGSRVLCFGKGTDGMWRFLTRVGSGEGMVSFQSSVPLTAIHLFALEDGLEPESVSLRRPPDWLTDHPRCDQLILSPSIFEIGCRRIVEINRNEGFQSIWMDLESVFDVFGGGQFSPFALKNFLSWVTRTWPDPQPSSVLLVGDTSWDFWGRYPHSDKVPNWTPSYHPARFPSFPSDLWFIEGKPGDRVADWLWGRIPCQNKRHLDDFLKKYLSFTENPAGRWSDRFLWVSDDNDPAERYTKDLFRRVLPLGMNLRHIRVRDYPFVDNFYYGEHLPQIQEAARRNPRALDFGKISPECNRQVLRALDAGASLFVYYGHSGPNVLAHERILFGGGSTYSDIPKLHNGGKAPLAMLMTCDVGRFDFAEIAKWSIGLAEELLLSPKGGCLGLITSAGKGLPSNHQALLLGAMDALFNREVRYAGVMHWLARLQSLITRGKNPALDMFTLLGDPLFSPPLRTNRLTVRPVKMRWNRNGSLDLECELTGNPHLSRENRIISCRLIGEDLGIRQVWNDLILSEENRFQMTLEDAWDLENILLSVEVGDSGRRPLLGAGGVVLEEVGPPPDWKSLYGSELPDLTLKPGEILFENPAPREGETVFVRVSVENTGKGLAENVEISAFEGDRDSPVSCFADVPPPVLKRILPGETKTLRLRWDRWQGVGLQTLTVRVDPENLVEEVSETDNEATATIRVLEKPDLGWGLVRDASPVEVDFSRAVPVPSEWILDPDRADLGPWQQLRPWLKDSHRAALLPVPLTNFGETPSATCSLKFAYWETDEGEPALVLDPFKIRPVRPSGLDGKLRPKKVPILLLPGFSVVKVEIDPEGFVDETTRKNNLLVLRVPLRFWDVNPPAARQRGTAERPSH